MNMLVRILTFLVLCGFCTSQTPDIEPAVEPVVEEDSKHCNGEPLAKNEYDHSTIISNEIDTISRASKKLRTFSSKYWEKEEGQLMNEFLKSLLDDLSLGKQSLKHLTHVSRHINVDNSIPYCGEVIIAVNEWREHNYFLESLVSWASESIQRLWNCVTTESVCSITDGRNFVLETIGYAGALNRFRFYSDVLTIYDKTRRQFTFFHSMIIWFRTLKFTNTNFDGATTRWLSDGFDQIEGTLLNTKYKIRNSQKDVEKMGSIIKSVNAKQIEISEYIEYLPTIRSRLFQMSELSEFLRESVKEMKKHSSRLWKNNFRGFTIWPDVEDQEKHEISPAYTLREDVQSSFSETSSLHAADGSSRVCFRPIIDSSYYDNDDSALTSGIKTLEAMHQKFCVDLAPSVQCVNKTLDARRYLARMNIMGHKINSEDGEIYYAMKPHYTSFVRYADDYIRKLIDHINDFDQDIGPFSSRDHVFVGESLSVDDITTFTSYLDNLSESFKAFFDIQCKTHQSAFYSELMLKYNDESGGTYFDTFDGDEFVEEVLEREGGVSLQEFMTSMNDYYTSDRMKTFYAKFRNLGYLYGYAISIFRRYKKEETRATRMSRIMGNLTTLNGNLAEMTTNGNRFSELATYTGLATMKILRDGFRSPIINEDEYGDFRESTETPLITTNVEPVNDGQINGNLFSGIVEYPTRLVPVDGNPETTRKYTSQLGQLMAFELGENAQIFRAPTCRMLCTYILNFEALRDAKVAVGCQNDRSGTFSETRDFVNADKSSILISQNDSSETVDIVYLDQYNQIYSSHHTFNDICRIHFAVAGTVSFTWDQVTAAIVDIPTDAPESARYNVYNARTASGFDKKIYVAKGVDKARWSSVTQTSDFLSRGGCRGIGVAFETVNKYGKVEIRSFIYDGNDVVFNPQSACPYDPDSIVDNVDEDEVLYMYYRETTVINSKPSRKTLQLFSNKKSKGFVYETRGDFNYAPSYVVMQPESQQETVEPELSFRSPRVRPPSLNVLCSEDYPCARNVLCHYKDGCEGSSCESVKEHKFGVCKS